MECLVILGFLVAPAMLAPRPGRDSRERISSQEELLARHGPTWGDSFRRA